MITYTNSNNPLVTVAMVTYNSEKYVAMAIESVLSSSYQNIELVISDDCSSDNTWNIIQSYKDARIKIFRNATNMGEYSNRNRCIDMSSGDFIIFIDGDDMVYPLGLEFMARMLHTFPECAIAQIAHYKPNVVYPVVISPRDFFINEYFGNSFLNTSFATVMFRRSVLLQLGRLPEDFRNGDNIIRLKIALQNAILLINDGATWWRETPGQASQQSQTDINNIARYHLFRQDLLSDLQMPLTEEEKAQALRNLKIDIAMIARKFIRKGELSPSGKLIRKFFVPLRYVILPPALIRKSCFDRYSAEKPLLNKWVVNFPDLNPLIQKSEI